MRNPLHEVVSAGPGTASESVRRVERDWTIVTVGFALLGIGLALVPWSGLLYIVAGSFLVLPGLAIAVIGWSLFGRDFRAVTHRRQDGGILMAGGLALTLAAWVSYLAQIAPYTTRNIVIVVGLILLVAGYASFRSRYSQAVGASGGLGLNAYLAGLLISVAAFLGFAWGGFVDPLAAVVTTLIGLGFLVMALGAAMLRREHRGAAPAPSNRG